MSHTAWYQNGEITKQQYDNLEYLKHYAPSLYKLYEKRIAEMIKRRHKFAKLIRKHKPIPLSLIRKET